MRFIFLGVFLASPVSSFYSHHSSKSKSLRLFSESARVSIEFCTGCRWMLRSTWMAQELLASKDPGIDSLTLIPSRIKPGGVFTVRGNDQVILWDRKEQGGFPDSFDLQQRVKRMIERNVQSDTTTIDCNDCPMPMVSAESTIIVREPHVAITYCTECQYLLRSAWFAQELFTTFDSELNAVTLIPHQPKMGVSPGIFVSVFGGWFDLIWSYLNVSLVCPP